MAHPGPSIPDVVYDGNPEDGRQDYPQRACDNCRRHKIKCVDKENPPCKRCRHMGLQCKFAMPPMPRAVVEETEATKARLSQLEGSVAGIFDKLDQMSNVLLKMNSRAETRSHRTHGDRRSFVSPQTVDSLPSYRPVASPVDSLNRPLSAASSYRPEVQPSSAGPGKRGTATWPTEDVGGMNNPYIRPARPASQSSMHSARSVPGTGVPAVALPTVPLVKRSPSPESDDDPLHSAVSGPFRALTRGEREQDPILAPHGDHSMLYAEDTTQQRPAKRRRRIGTEAGDEERNRSQRDAKGDPLRHCPDPITLGLVTEEEGRKLYDAFFKAAYPFTPVFDPERDTFESLRERSPYCISVIVLIALRQRESTGVPSEVTNRIGDEVEKLTKLTLFSPMATLETLQGMAILISYSENAWRIGCHAMALAIDMRLYRCLPYLHKIRCESRQPNLLLERQRSLIVGARIWLSLVRQAYELSYNHALPILFPSGGGKRTLFKRELLDHPLANMYDSRLVISVEMAEVRESAFKPFESVVAVDQGEMDELLREANEGMRTLYAYWTEYYERLGLPPEHFLRVELSNQRAYSVIYTNSPAWFGVQTKEDVPRLTIERQQWVAAALRSAAFLVSSVANKRLEGAEFGNHNFHVGIVATARYLIRMCELLPDVCDRFEISQDIDRLLLKLPYAPVSRVADGLRRTLARAREQGILPYTPISEAASKRPVPSPSLQFGSEDMSMFPGLNPFPWHDPVQIAPSEIPEVSQLASAAEMPFANAPNVPRADSIAWADEFDLAAWFPATAEAPGATAFPLDFTALDVDMANLFPAAPHVWLDES